MRRLLALLVVLAVTGCSADATTPKSQQPLEKVASAAGTPTPPVGPVASAVSTSAPAVPYLLKGRVHIGGDVVPGRYASIIVRGKTWLGWKRWDGPWTWGIGIDTGIHRLRAGTIAQLSPTGRYLATVTGGEHCEGVGMNREGRPCTVRLVDTSGAEPDRRIRVERTVVLVGVSDRGEVVLTEGAALDWNELIWDPAGGADAVQPLLDSPPLRTWAMQWWGPGDFGQAGFELQPGNVPGRWLGEIVDGMAWPQFQIPEDVEPGPGRAWVLASPWLGPTTSGRPDLDGALELTVPVLTGRALGKRGKLGPKVRVRAPAGWFFAKATPADEGFFWEDSDTFLARVVDSRQGGDRISRCDLPVATCVLIES